MYLLTMLHNKKLLGILALMAMSLCVYLAAYDAFIWKILFRNAYDHRNLQLLKVKNVNKYGKRIHLWNDTLITKEIPWKDYDNKFVKRKTVRGVDNIITKCMIAKNNQLPRTCSVGFNDKRLSPIVALVSYPGSGNTWTRYLVERSTGIFTGSIYKSKYLFDKGNFCGETITPWTYRTIVVKTHERLTDSKIINPSQVSKVILLIRNPYKAMVAFRHWKLTNTLTKHAKASYFQGKGWKEYASKQIEWWNTLYSHWLDQPKPILVLRYEDIQNNVDQTLSKITQFLGYPDNRRHCLENATEGAFHRKSACNGTLKLYTKELQNLIDENIYLVEQKLFKKGLPKLNYNISVLQCQN